jgi:hypothetical protein
VDRWSRCRWARREAGSSVEATARGQVGIDREFAMLIALLFWALLLGLYVSSR